MKKGEWSESEVKKLFDEVEDVKKNNLAIKQAFIRHAQKFSRKPNSVRNFYYYSLGQLAKDDERRDKLGIDLALHQKLDFVYFSEQEEKKLIENIQSLLESGLSIRKACQQLANGDVCLMLRYQNKYRNFLRKQKESSIPKNIIPFKKKEASLSDSDINSLFLGLVRLVKKNALQEASSAARLEKQNAVISLRRAMSQLGEKDRDLDKLKAQILALKEENCKLRMEIIRQKCNKAQKEPKDR